MMLKKILILSLLPITLLPINSARANESDKLLACVESFDYVRDRPDTITVHSSQENYYLVRLDSGSNFSFRVIQLSPCQTIYNSEPEAFKIAEVTNIRKNVAAEFDKIIFDYAIEFNKLNPQ